MASCNVSLYPIPGILALLTNASRSMKFIYEQHIVSRNNLILLVNICMYYIYESWSQCLCQRYDSVHKICCNNMFAVAEFLGLSKSMHMYIYIAIVVYDISFFHLPSAKKACHHTICRFTNELEEKPFFKLGYIGVCSYSLQQSAENNHNHLYLKYCSFLFPQHHCVSQHFSFQRLKGKNFTWFMYASLVS